MSGSGAVSHIQRVQIFVDFWNFTLSMKGIEDSFPVDWVALPKVLMCEVQKLDLSATKAQYHYQGIRIYGSFDPKNPGDDKLRKWASTFLAARVPGCHVDFVPRQKKQSPPKCPTCFQGVDLCPVCRADMRGTEEKGVDTRIVTDMISLAWEGTYDVAVLVSADRDFVPVVQFLVAKGKRVIHAAFPPKAAALQQACWAQISLPTVCEEFRRT